MHVCDLPKTDNEYKHPKLQYIFSEKTCCMGVFVSQIISHVTDTHNIALSINHANIRITKQRSKCDY